MAITVTATSLPEVKIIEPKVFGDARGYFYESFNGREFVLKPTRLPERGGQWNW